MFVSLGKSKLSSVYRIVLILIFAKLISVQYLYIRFYFVLGRNYGERVKSMLALHLF